MDGLITISDLAAYEAAIQEHSIVVFSTTWCPDCHFLKTFIKDKIRGFLISSILICGILMLFIKLYDAIGNYIILAFIGILILLLLLVLILFLKSNQAKF